MPGQLDGAYGVKSQKMLKRHSFNKLTKSGQIMMNPLNPKKLLLSKWTAVTPVA